MGDKCAAAIAAQTKHGHAKRGARTKTYRSWYAMRQRCNDPNTVGWEHYGGKGIVVTPRWDSFECFLLDMGECPSPKHSIDRLDNEKHYILDNCRWATKKEQDNNRTSNVHVAWNGREQNIGQWAEELGINYATLYRRLVVNGWAPERAMTQPVRMSGRWP